MDATLGLPLFRRTDPDTSREAAELVKPKISRHEKIILGVIKTMYYRHLSQLTCGEITQYCDLSYEQVHKRMKGMVRKGLIVPSNKRICTVNGTRMRTWNPAQDGGSRGDGSPHLED